MIYLIRIGFLDIGIWDILDIAIVAVLMYQAYKLLRGSLAFNILLGVALLFIVVQLTNVLEMNLLSTIIGQFMSVGVLALLIVFQPEIRRFLLMLGKGVFKRRSDFLSKFLRLNETDEQEAEHNKLAFEVRRAVDKLRKSETGALILLGDQVQVDSISSVGTQVDALATSLLIESIFKKDSPLHDGALLITGNRIHSAGLVLPVSENQNLPKKAGLRHRAALGITESSNVLSIIVSEETGNVSYAHDGIIHFNIDTDKLQNVMLNYLTKKQELETPKKKEKAATIIQPDD